MPYYDRIDVLEGIDVNNTSKSKECDFCYYWYFLDKGFKFQSDVYNGCYDVLMKSTSLSNITILNSNATDYCCIISGISKSEATNLCKMTLLTQKSEHYKT